MHEIILLAEDFDTKLLSEIDTHSVLYTLW